KVPLKVVAQQYGPQVRQEVLGDAMQKTFGDAVRDKNLRVAGYPRFEAEPLTDGSSEFQYSATFEIYPEVAVGDISGAAIERPVLEVGDSEIDKTLDIMRKQRATYAQVERVARTDDRVTIDYKGTIGGVEFQGGSAKDLPVILGAGRLLPEFEANLSGVKA